MLFNYKKKVFFLAKLICNMLATSLLIQNKRTGLHSKISVTAGLSMDLLMVVSLFLRTKQLHIINMAF